LWLFSIQPSITAFKPECDLPWSKLIVDISKDFSDDPPSLAIFILKGLIEVSYSLANSEDFTITFPARSLFTFIPRTKTRLFMHLRSSQ